MLVVIFLLVAYAFPLVFKQVFFFADWKCHSQHAIDMPSLGVGVNLF